MGRAIFTKCTLPTSEANALLQLLSMNGVDGATLFPGYDGVARAVCERAHWLDYADKDITSCFAELIYRKDSLLERLSLMRSRIFGGQEL